jgi:predicted nucleic-acid-binding protein
MRALDTNVLLRYLLKDDVAQAESARRFIHQHCGVKNPAFVNRIVICELVWVLESVYNFNKSMVVDILGRILRTDQLNVEDSEETLLALELYQKHTVDFTDILMGVVNRHKGYSSTATFDKKAAKLAEFELLP